MVIRALRWMMVVSLAACSFEGQAIRGDASGGSDTGVASDGSIMDAFVDAPGVDARPAITLAQVCSGVSSVIANGINCMPASPQSVGNTNIVIVDWGGGSASLISLSDSAGNLYFASGLTNTSDMTSVLWFATITNGGSNRVTATLSAPAPNAKIRVLEYAGLAATTPYLGGTTRTGVNDTMLTVGPVVTSSAHALLLAAARPDHTTDAVAPFTARDNSDGDLVEDEEVFALGSYSASATQTPPGAWVMLLAAFRGQ